MKWLLRPALLLVAALAVMLVGVFLWMQLGPTDNQPQPLLLAEDDQEIVFLSTAISAPNWERFVAALRRTTTRLQKEIPELQGRFEAAYPPKSTDIPRVILSWQGQPQRLVFPWYKLTSNWKTGDWVQALLKNRRPPLAIIGGSSSEAARELATQLQRQTADLAPSQRPVLILTTATADQVYPHAEAARNGSKSRPSPSLEQPVSLNQIYPGRTFRFCFSNRQMATAVTSFLWSRDELRPDSDPVYLVKWEDDSYSGDLIDGFMGALPALAAQGGTRDWAFLTGSVQAGGLPPLAGGLFPWDRCGLDGSNLRLAILPTVQPIATSVGGVLPNRYEAQVASDTSREMSKYAQRRPLLIVTGQEKPSRRFLKALERLDPAQARRLVVATGDGLSFNTVYRDRRTLWHIQDLPLALVFFCHYNPVEVDAGFRPAPQGVLPPGLPLEGEPPREVTPPQEKLRDSSSTGTEDVLLNADIVESLIKAFRRDDQPCADSAELSERLGIIRLLPEGGLGFDPEAPLLFNDDGNRRSSTGEHVVSLRPVFDGERVLPRSILEVWKWHPPGIDGAGPRWRQVGDPFVLSYDPPQVEGGISQ